LDIINNFEIENEKFYFYDISKVINSSKKLKKLPIVLKVLLEANLRKSKDSIEFNKIVNIFTNRMNSQIGFYPSRIIMQDFTGIPAIVDLASMRDSVNEKERNKINPQIMLDLVLDQSLSLNGNHSKIDIEKEYEVNYEKYEFAKWSENAFSNLRIIPPGSGVYHQVNLEYLSTILHIENKDGKFFLYPETIVGTDFQTSMMNSLGVLGWSVNAIEAEEIILGLPVSLNLPKVVGININGELKEGITSSDLVSTLTKRLKKYDASGKLIEFYGEGLKYLTLEDRMTIANMAPEYNAICTFFAIDDKTISYFNKTRENEDFSKIIKTYLEKQELFYTSEELDYDEILELDLTLLEPIIKGPKRLQDRVDINSLKDLIVMNKSKELKDTDIVLASITSCISNSNPYLLIHAALVAKKALSYGLKVNKNIKTSFSPGSLIVKEYLEKLDLLQYLEKLGFNITGYECNTNSMNVSNLDVNIETQIKESNLNICSLITEEIDLEDKLYNLIKSNYLMSPSLVIIFSLIGNMKFDIYNNVIGVIDDKDIYLKDLWPTSKEVGGYLQKLDNTLYKDIYKEIFKGNEFWRKLIVEKNDVYKWNSNSTYIQPTQIFEEVSIKKIEIKDAEILALLDDDITSEHISPFGQIPLYSPAAKYLENRGLKSFEYGSFENRHGNAELMKRATFDNIRLKNLMVSKEGGYTKDYNSGEILSIFDKSQKSKKENKDLVIIAGSNYGSGKSRNWAAKGTKLLGIKVVIAKSFNQSHRRELLSLGILPLEFIDDDINSLKLKGYERITILLNEIKASSKVVITIHKKDIDVEIDLLCRLDNDLEVKYYNNGGVLNYLLQGIK